VSAQNFSHGEIPSTKSDNMPKHKEPGIKFKIKKITTAAKLAAMAAIFIDNTSICVT
jgi:hypothetical protein